MNCHQVPPDVAGPASIWHRVLGSVPSCSAPVASSSDPAIARICADDPTALSVDLTLAGSAAAKGHCFHYRSDCTFDVNKLKEISFDFTAQGCADVWAAPLWMVPKSWGPTQWLSGEIDFLEICRGTANVSFGSDSGQYVAWGVNANDAQGRIRIQFDQAADVITAQLCDLQGQNCKLAYTRKGYFEDIKHSSNPSGANMSFVSDIWNGSAGDAGFAGCALGGRHDSSCKYSVRNIKVSSRTGEKLFSDACAALNA